MDLGEVSAVDECRCSINVTNMLPCYHRLLEEGFIEDRSAFPLDRIDHHWHLFDAAKLEAEATGRSTHASVERVAPPDYFEPSATAQNARRKRRLADATLQEGLRASKRGRQPTTNAPEILEVSPEPSSSSDAGLQPVSARNISPGSSSAPPVVSSPVDVDPTVAPRAVERRTSIALPDFLQHFFRFKPCCGS